MKSLLAISVLTVFSMSASDGKRKNNKRVVRGFDFFVLEKDIPCEYYLLNKYFFELLKNHESGKKTPLDCMDNLNKQISNFMFIQQCTMEKKESHTSFPEKKSLSKRRSQSDHTS